MVIGVALAFILSGCAGGRTRQELARLQSQVGLLDERVIQLERASASWGGVSSDTMGEAMTETATPSLSSASTEKSPSARQQPSTKISVKPSTTEIQQALKNAGFYQGAMDGKMGPMTREAIKELQRVHGLSDDGVVGRQTWAKLKAYADLSASNGELNAAEVLK